MTRSRTRICLTATIIFTILAGLLPVAGSQREIEGGNWERLFYDEWGSSFNPQSQITKDNVDRLEFKWVFSVPRAPPGLWEDIFYGPNEGVEMPPVVVNGVVYFVTQYGRIFALNAETGNELWDYLVPLNRSRGPIASIVHNHGLQIVEGTVYFFSADCVVYALDAFNGDVEFTIEDVCLGIPGNLGGFSATHPPNIYRRGRILVLSPILAEAAPRGFVAGYDLDSRELLWRWYIIPPPGGDPEWDSQYTVEKDDGTIVTGPSKGNIDPYLGDWGTTTLFGGGGVWGHMSIDEEEGVVYLGTANPAPDWNATMRPGPNLYTNSIVALNVTNGEMIWYYQTTPHDTNDYDCAWNTILAEIEIDRRTKKAVFQGCKNGYLYALDAATGEPLWEPLLAPDLAVLNEGNANKGNNADMTLAYGIEKLEEDGSFIQCPGALGGIETPGAHAYNTIFTASKNDCNRLFPGPVQVRPGAESGYIFIGLRPPFAGFLDWPLNSTVFAVNAATGRVKWTYFIEGTIVHGGCCTVSGGVVYFGDRAGFLYALDADSGDVLWKMKFGVGFGAPPSIAASASGEMRLFFSTSGGLFADTPGEIFAFGLLGELPDEQPPTEPDYTQLVVYAAVAVAIASITYALVTRRKIRRLAPAKASSDSAPNSLVREE
ncbi:MAG: PQQ-binding-like beta-propeller repeat protein [Candidatus Geothermarchaeales archaeon]